MLNTQLLHVFSTFSPGGPQVRTIQLMNLFGSTFEHTVVASDGVYSALDLISPGVKIRVAEDYPRMKGESLVATLWKTGRYLRSCPCDTLLTYNWGAIETAWANSLLGHRRHIHHEDGFGVEETLRRSRLRGLIRRLALNGCETLVVPSASLVRIAREEWRFPTMFVQQIPNGVDLALFEPDRNDGSPMIGSFTKSPGEIWIGCVSGLRPEKNVRRLVKVAAPILRQNHRVKVVICGEGPERDSIIAEAFNLGVADQVLMAGFRADPHRFLHLFDILAIPSDTEQFPICLIEGMAAGCSVVGTDVGDVREILSAANGAFVVEPSAEPRFTESLHHLVVDPPLRKHLGALNRARVSANYGMHLMAERYLNLWRGQSAL